MKNYIVLNLGSETWEENRAWQGCPTIARTQEGKGEKSVDDAHRNR